SNRMHGFLPYKGYINGYYTCNLLEALLRDFNGLLELIIKEFKELPQLAGVNFTRVGVSVILYIPYPVEEGPCEPLYEILLLPGRHIPCIISEIHRSIHYILYMDG